MFDSCSCSCISDDFDGPEVMSVGIVKARKMRPCCGCGGTILPGQYATVISGKWDGEWQRFSYHQNCHDALEALADKAMSGWLYGCPITDCLGSLIEGATWPKDRDVIEMVSEVYRSAEARPCSPT